MERQASEESADGKVNGSANGSRRNSSACVEYSAEDIDGIIKRLEAATAKQIAVKSSTVKTRAAERDLLAQAEDGRNLLNLAVKGDKTQLESVFGGDCERIGRLEQIMREVEFTDMHAKDARWGDLKNIILSIEAVLKQAGLYKPWVPQKKEPPSNIKYKGVRTRFSPGESVYMRIEYEGEAVTFTVEPPLPPGTQLDEATGHITGAMKCGDELEETTYVITATNEAGSATCELTFSVGVPPPGSLTYPFLQPECYVGEAVSWEASIPGGEPDSWTVAPALPLGLSICPRTGTITGVLQDVADTADYTVTASNKGGEVSATFTLTVKIAPPVALSYPKAREMFGIGEVVYLEPDLVMKKLNDNPAGESSRPPEDVSFKVDPALPMGYKLDEKTGIISGESDAAIEEMVYSVTAENAGGAVSADLTFCIRLTAPMNLSYPGVAANYERGQAVKLAPEVAGVVDEWSIEPALPAGLELDSSTGAITGTPTDLTPDGPGVWRVIAKNDIGDAFTELTFAVVRAPPSNLQYPSMSPTYPLDEPLEILPTIEGEVDEYTVSPELPSGITLDAKTGVISGSPSTATSLTTYKVQAQAFGEMLKASTDLAFAVEVVPPRDLRYPGIQAMYTLGEDASITPEFIGKVHHWSVDPALPDGMVLDTATGTISGAPLVTSEGCAYSVFASNEVGSTSTALTFEVTPPPPEGLSYPSAGNPFVIGDEVMLEPEVEGGSCRNFSVEPALPLGLVLDPATGVISGAATEITELATYKVIASNARGSATCELTFNVSEKPEEAEVDQAFAEKIEEIVELAELLEMEEPNKAARLGDWMIWMVHRAYLNDETLVEFDFSNRIMPPAYVEKRIAPKLMTAMETNTNIKALILPNSNLQKEQGHQLAEALKVNRTLEKLNIENNNLDSDAVRDVADALCCNEDSAIEQLRTSYQKHVGAFFGRPVEEKFGQLMEKNTRILKLGFVCNDAHWRNSIDRALLRNNDIARRRRKRGESAFEDIVAKDKTLSRLLLSSSPEKAVSEFFDDGDANLNIIRAYVASNKKLPTSAQLQSFSKSQSTPLKYSVVAPLIKDFREKIVNSTVKTDVTVADDYYVETVGNLRAWSLKNENWSLDVWPSSSERFNFMSAKQPIIEVSEKFAEWLRPSS